MHNTLLANARCKVAQALVGQKALAISDNMTGKEEIIDIRCAIKH